MANHVRTSIYRSEIILFYSRGFYICSDRAHQCIVLSGVYLAACI
jgi:hypothetical protein